MNILRAFTPKGLLKIGLSFVFIYIAIASIALPNAWVSLSPVYLRFFFAPQIIIYAAAVYEIILGLWLISGKQTYYAAILSAITLLLVILFNLGSLMIIFYDISLIFASLALVSLSYKGSK